MKGAVPVWGGGEQAEERTPLLFGRNKKGPLSTALDFYLYLVNKYNEMVHLVFGGIWMAFGVITFQAITGCLVLTAIYLIIQILTTIGYGDVTPKTSSGRYETSFYALGTILFLGSCFNVLLNAIAERMEAMAEHAQKVQLAKSIPGVEVVLDSHHQSHFRYLFGVWHDAMWEFLAFSMMILIGTIFYATYEACTCSYGVTSIAGCSDSSYQVCVLTGGSMKTWIDSFYMVMITLTTIGFGDYTPQSYFGRVFFIPWALVGVISMGRFATSFGAALNEASRVENPIKSKLEIREHLEQVLGNDPVTGSAKESLSLAEFSWFLLKENKLITAHDEKVALAAFDNLDWVREGNVSFGDAVAYVKDHFDDFLNDD